MIQMMGAVFGLAAGILFGRYQLKRWNMDSKKSMAVLAAGSAIVFLAGGYLMLQYEYHILKMIRYWILMYSLLLLAMLDSRDRLIPNKALLVLLGVRTVLLAADCACFPQLIMEILISSVVGLAGGGGIFLLAGLIARKGIGMGDVKMIGVIGYYLGFQVLMSDLIITMTFTVLGGLAVLAFRKASLHSEMAFAPYAAAGTIITILMGF
ncbi:MAG: A24 family peptidase [Lachnospiraceae bacterium]|nr:A24 family peptidase [Lachnospiraceae bacterium]